MYVHITELKEPLIIHSETQDSFGGCFIRLTTMYLCCPHITGLLRKAVIRRI